MVPGGHTTASAGLGAAYAAAASGGPASEPVGSCCRQTPYDPRHEDQTRSNRRQTVQEPGRSGRGHAVGGPVMDAAPAPPPSRGSSRVDDFQAPGPLLRVVSRSGRRWRPFRAQGSGPGCRRRRRQPTRWRRVAGRPHSACTCCPGHPHGRRRFRPLGTRSAHPRRPTPGRSGRSPWPVRTCRPTAGCFRRRRPERPGPDPPYHAQARSSPARTVTPIVPFAPTVARGKKGESPKARTLLVQSRTKAKAVSSGICSTNR